jgi:pyruvate/2-oxoglutarate dehydrogenase complex dihydrolipoamide dehydrogenase (E3) component
MSPNGRKNIVVIGGEVIGLTTCVYRKLDSAILVVKAAENWV